MRAGTCSVAMKNKNKPEMGTCSVLQGNTNLRRELARFVRKAHLRLELIELARINQTEPRTCSICEGKPNRDGNLLTF
jgi:hypothetical protein